jgi:hypothetical protein
MSEEEKEGEVRYSLVPVMMLMIQGEPRKEGGFPADPSRKIQLFSKAVFQYYKEKGEWIYVPEAGGFGRPGHSLSFIFPEYEESTRRLLAEAGIIPQPAVHCRECGEVFDWVGPWGERVPPKALICEVCVREATLAEGRG